ncbi:Lipase 3 [Orchesella cincta]|uniref:Lipase n=1 Tax=Orchesella cincta TaxID=48709 RepID=A0A1D2MBB7_ORCCI|nr:Lipase 3 [Orchesella cincta]
MNMTLIQNDVEATLFPQVSTRLFEWSRRISDFFTTRSSRFFGLKEPLNTTQLIEAQGYPSETHQVTTEDGYILELHRIPHGLNSQRNVSRPPMIVFHGHWRTSADWVINQPKEDALGFVLSDRGYDVWLANERGNGYSMRHISLTPSDPKFWDFSIDEIGLYDVPAIIDYVLKQTGYKKLHYTAYSLGGAELLVALSKRPEYNEKVQNAVLLAPAVYLQNFVYGILKFLSPVAPLLHQIFNVQLDGFSFYPPLFTNLYHRILPVICHPRVDIFGVCMLGFRTFYGNDMGLIPRTKLPLITMVAPSSSSVKKGIWAIQQMGWGEFSQYDYGISRNREVYGCDKPPRYNLTNVHVPILIIIGLNDIISSPRDCRTLAKRLPNYVDVHYVNNLFFTHSSFTYAKGVGELVYSRIVKAHDAFRLTREPV